MAKPPAAKPAAAQPRPETVPEPPSHFDAPAPVISPDQMMGTMLAATEWNVVLAALQVAPMPMRDTWPVFIKLRQQLDAARGVPQAPQGTVVRMNGEA